MGGELFKFGSIGAFAGQEESDAAWGGLLLKRVEGVEEELWGFLGSESSGHEEDEVSVRQSEGAAGNSRGLEELIDIDAVLDNGDSRGGNAAECGMLASDSFAAGYVVCGEFSGEAIGEHNDWSAIGDTDSGDMAGNVGERCGDAAKEIGLVQEGKDGPRAEGF